MPLNLNFGTPSERINPNAPQGVQRISPQNPLESSGFEEEAPNEAFPKRKINTPMPIEWKPRKKRKAGLDLMALIQSMSGGGV
jgi:hypothetical protein